MDEQVESQNAKTNSRISGRMRAWLSIDSISHLTTLVMTEFVF